MPESKIDMNDTTTAYGVPTSQENAILVLAAADDLGVSQESVRVTDGGFAGPKAVLHKAFPEVKKADDSREAADKKAVDGSAKNERK